MPTIADPTILDKALLIPHIGRVLGAAAYTLVTYPITSTPKANTLLKDVVFGALRTHVSHIRPGQERLLDQSTESQYLHFVKSHGLPVQTDVLDQNLEVFWLGPKSSSKVLLFFHGGGYSISASPGHIAYMHFVQQKLSKNSSFAVAIVAYTLAPHAQYPTQLGQAAQSLQWLISSQDKKPSDIIIAGDSAGANLTLALVSHLLHPHPDVATKIELSEPLAAVVLISPWVKFPTDDDSAKRNRTSDMVTPLAAVRWSTQFLGTRPGDNYNQAYLADAAWFQSLQNYVGDVLIWGGGGEVLIDSIREISKKLKAAHPRVDYVEQPGAAHEDFIISRLLGYTSDEGGEVVASWIAQRAGA